MRDVSARRLWGKSLEGREVRAIGVLDCFLIWGLTRSFSVSFFAGPKIVKHGIVRVHQ